MFDFDYDYDVDYDESFPEYDSEYLDDANDCDICGYSTDLGFDLCEACAIEETNARTT